jgi:hypothetical protein
MSGGSSEDRQAPYGWISLVARLVRMLNDSTNTSLEAISHKTASRLQQRIPDVQLLVFALCQMTQRP